MQNKPEIKNFSLVRNWNGYPKGTQFQEIQVLTKDEGYQTLYEPIQSAIYTKLEMTSLFEETVWDYPISKSWWHLTRTGEPIKNINTVADPQQPYQWFNTHRQAEIHAHAERAKSKIRESIELGIQIARNKGKEEPDAKSEWHLALFKENDKWKVAVKIITKSEIYDVVSFRPEETFPLWAANTITDLLGIDEQEQVSLVAQSLKYYIGPDNVLRPMV